MDPEELFDAFHDWVQMITNTFVQAAAALSASRATGYRWQLLPLQATGSLKYILGFGLDNEQGGEYWFMDPAYGNYVEFIVGESEDGFEIVYNYSACAGEPHKQRVVYPMDILFIEDMDINPKTVTEAFQEVYEYLGHNKFPKQFQFSNTVH